MSTLTQVNAKSCAKLQHFQQIPITSTDNLRNSDVKPANWLHKLLVKKAQLITQPLSPHPLCILSSLIPPAGVCPASHSRMSDIHAMYNPYRGRDTLTRQSDGGTRYARLPPVIEIIPLSGYILPHTQHILWALLAVLGLCCPRYDRERASLLPRRGCTSITAGKRGVSRVPPVDR